MTEQEYQKYWNYYLSIEREFIGTRSFVAHSLDNSYTYSDEFAKIILVSGAEIDSLFQIFLEKKGIEPTKGKYFTIKDYAKVETYDRLIRMGSLSTPGHELTVIPFENLDSTKHYSNLEWWKAYQKIKHNRSEHYKLANLINSANCVAAHHKVLRILLSIVVPKVEAMSSFSVRHYSQFWNHRD